MTNSLKIADLENEVKRLRANLDAIAEAGRNATVDSSNVFYAVGVLYGAALSARYGGILSAQSLRESIENRLAAR